MPTIEELKSKLASHKEELKEKYKVKDIGIFCSYVRREQHKKKRSGHISHVL
jgi:predicted nucleotidyltransferase